MKNYQAIYQICTDNNAWLDYYRSQVEKPDDCLEVMRMLEKDRGKKFRARVEDWSDGAHEPNAFYGDWDKNMLSPADQANGRFHLDEDYYPPKDDVEMMSIEDMELLDALELAATSDFAPFTRNDWEEFLDTKGENPRICRRHDKVLIMEVDTISIFYADVDRCGEDIITINFKKQ